jgi:polyisoprenoid-binding protein YceI
VIRALALVVAVLTAVPLPAAAESMTFKLLTNYSQASFRSDAPLETFVGTAALEAIQGTPAVDPASPQDARRSVTVDMNRWVTFEVQAVEAAGPLTPGKETPAKVHGVLTIKQKAVPKTGGRQRDVHQAHARAGGAQKRFGFTSDNLKVKARLITTFTEHGLQIPQLLFLKVANELQLTTDLVFARAQ